MVGRTISEKILARKSAQDARARNLVVCEVDSALGTDGSVPMALDYFKAMGGETVRDPTRPAFARDHDVPAMSPQTIELHRSRSAGRTRSLHASER
jgi:3-isopropylmalate/(R)-2-methylmalate dehydratase large subunit